jgi:hypothetical protein
LSTADATFLGCTPLHFAAANGHLPIVRLLLNRGADPRIGDKHGVRPEDVAADYGYHAIVDLLRDVGKTIEPTPPTMPAPNQPTSPSRSRTLKVQRSIGDPLATQRPLPSSLGGGSSCKESSDSTTEIPALDRLRPQAVDAVLYQPGRRPSLPTLLRNPPASRSYTYRRPSSAGEGADRKRNASISPLNATQVRPTSPIPETNVSEKDAHEEPATSMHKATSKYSLSSIFKKTAETPIFEEGPRGSTESSIRLDVNSNRERTLDEVFTSPALPPKVVNAAWYRARKSSEVVVSSPLALETIIARETSPDRTPSASHADSPSRTRSTSAPDAKASGSLAPRQLRQFVPAVSRSSSYSKSNQPIRPDQNTQAEHSESTPLLKPASEIISQSSSMQCSTQVCKCYPLTLSTVSPILRHSVSDPVHTQGPLLNPPLVDTTRTREDSLSSNSEASSNVEGGSWATASSVNTALTPPSPTDQLSTSSTAARRTIGSGVSISLQGISSRAEAQALVELARQNILASASTLPPSGAALHSATLAEQLEMYGRTLQLEKHFARGEAQRNRTGELPRHSEVDSDDEDEKVNPNPVSPNSSSSDLTASPLGHSFIRSSERRPTAHLPKSSLIRSASASLAGSHLEQTVSPSAPASTTRPRRHKPIANMSYLQHKHSLEARLNRQYGAGDIDEEDGVDEEDEFGVLRQPDPKRRSSTIEIIQTLPTPTESPGSIASVFGSTDPVFREEEGSPIYQSPLANANAPPTDRPRAPVSKPNPLIPGYILPSENAFPPRSQITARSDPSARPTVKKPSNLRRPSTMESAESFPVVRAVSPLPHRSEDVSSPPPSGANSVRRFGLRSLVHTLTKR